MEYDVLFTPVATETFDGTALVMPIALGIFAMLVVINIAFRIFGRSGARKV